MRTLVSATLDGELAIETGDPPPDPDTTARRRRADPDRHVRERGRPRRPGRGRCSTRPPASCCEAVPPGGRRRAGADASSRPSSSRATRGTANMTFTARLAQATGHPVTAEWHTVDDAATSPPDFTGTVGPRDVRRRRDHEDDQRADQGRHRRRAGRAPPASACAARAGPSSGVTRAAGTIVSDDLGITDSTPDTAGPGRPP